MQNAFRGGRLPPETGHEIGGPVDVLEGVRRLIDIGNTKAEDRNE